MVSLPGTLPDAMMTASPLPASPDSPVLALLAAAPVDDGGPGVGTRLTAVLVLVLLNAFFVAAEFALVGARRSRIDAYAQKNVRGAKSVQEALTNLDRYISGTQLGITLASLALGWIGEPALATLVDAGLGLIGIDIPSGAAHTTAGVVTAFVIITFLHIVLGELAPKSLALVAP
ncbi:MAG: CNNM domain-containing protein, partial [Gemmatimonadaceae bacterium]|nr:CNNM domain-containing protein [Gemmatimonadaceae bacterium]